MVLFRCSSLHTTVTLVLFSVSLPLSKPLLQLVCPCVLSLSHFIILSSLTMSFFSPDLNFSMSLYFCLSMFLCLYGRHRHCLFMSIFPWTHSLFVSFLSFPVSFLIFHPPSPLREFGPVDRKETLVTCSPAHQAFSPLSGPGTSMGGHSP